MAPQIIPMSTIKRLWPSPEYIKNLLGSKPPGGHFGIITKTGANAKTRTLTTLSRTVHKKTLRVFYIRKDVMIHDELEETVPTDLVIVRHIGLISNRKRLAFDCFVRRIESPQDPIRRLHIQEQEASRLKSIESASLERSNLLASRADLVRRANLAGVLPEDLQRIEDDLEDRESEEEMERERERMKIGMERVELVDKLRREVVQRLKDGFEGLEDEEGVVFEGLSEARRAEVVERELKKEVNKVGNEAAVELGYEDLEREIDLRVESRRLRREFLEKEARRKVEEEETEGKERELKERRDKVQKMQALLESRRAALEKQQEFATRKMEELALARTNREVAASSPRTVV
ncbi:hypothetical protein BDY24DRAFT_418971 [Mrakia frigida]|uniref:uncharacterized protein n=1 Tax=Mrakia frigida TaxID=29902 RepID=UPI003FCC1CBA